MFDVRTASRWPRRFAVLLPAMAALLSSLTAGAAWTIPTGCTGQLILSLPAGICLFEDTKFRYRAFVQFDDNDFTVFDNAHSVTPNWEWLLKWDDFPPEDEGPNVNDDLNAAGRHKVAPHPASETPFGPEMNHLYYDAHPLPSLDTGPLVTTVPHGAHTDRMETKLVNLGPETQLWIEMTHPQPIPALPAWGMTILIVSFVVAGAWSVQRRRQKISV